MSLDQASFQRTDRDGRRTLSVSGEIDLATAARFRKELDAVVAGAHSSVQIDLSGVTFMDSTGLHALVEVRRAAGSDVELVLVDPSSSCRRVLEITGVQRLFEIAECVPEGSPAA